MAARLKARWREEEAAHGASAASGMASRAGLSNRRGIWQLSIGVMMAQLKAIHIGEEREKLKAWLYGLCGEANMAKMACGEGVAVWRGGAIGLRALASQPRQSA
jgi:hypothetical protein